MIEPRGGDSGQIRRLVPPEWRSLLANILKFFLGCLVPILWANVGSASPAAATLAAQILDAAKPAAERDALIAAHAGRAGELMAAMTEKLPVGTDDEYKAIPWIWKVAIAAGKRNDAAELKSLIGVTLPQSGEPLRDWQAVVVGGGIINGLSLTGVWPGERIAEILRADKDLKTRWSSLLESAAVMADNEKIRSGTRYDALRVVAMDTWERQGARLEKYLNQTANAELQQGAVSGLSDVKSRRVAPALIGAWKNLAKRNRNFALDALLRDESRIAALLDAMADGRIEAASLGAERMQKLKTLPNSKLRTRAEKILK